MKKRDFFKVGGAGAVAIAAGAFGWMRHIDQKDKPQLSDLEMLFDKVICKDGHNRQLFNEYYSRGDSLYVLDALLNNNVFSGNISVSSDASFNFKSAYKAEIIVIEAKNSLSAESIHAIVDNLSTALIAKNIITTDLVGRYGPAIEPIQKENLLVAPTKEKQKDIMSFAKLPAAKTSQGFSYYEIFAKDGSINALRAKADRLLGTYKANNPSEIQNTSEKSR